MDGAVGLWDRGLADTVLDLQGVCSFTLGNSLMSFYSSSLQIPIKKFIVPSLTLHFSHNCGMESSEADVIELLRINTW